MQVTRTLGKHLKTAALGALLALSCGAMAQSFPSKPIRIVVPFGTGGVADQTARALGQRLSEQLGQAVVVDNKPSAGGIVAGEAVAKAEPDGHTLLLMSNGTAVSQSLFKSLPFDAQKDFAPISTLGTFDIALVAAEGSRFASMADLLAYIKANPGKLNLGTVGVGSTQNLAARLLDASAGLELTVIPFKGTPDVITALRGGTIDAAVEILGPMMGQINAKALRPLAVFGAQRATKLPDVPTLKEAGVDGASASSWNALAAPAKTPPAVIDRLSQEVAIALAKPDLRSKLAELNIDAQASSPQELAQLLASEIKRWGDVIARAKIDKQ